MISQGLFFPPALYFLILFHVLTKQDDTRQNTLNLDFYLTCYGGSSLIYFSFFIILEGGSLYNYFNCQPILSKKKSLSVPRWPWFFF